MKSKKKEKREMTMKKEEARGWDYLNLSLFAFAGLGIEVVYANLLEPVIYGGPMSEWSVAQSIIHWILTCITWGLITFFLVKYADSKYDFNLFKDKGKIKLWQWITTIICIVLELISTYIDWNGFKVIREYQSNGMPKFVFQYIYYVFETGLFLLIIVFGQKACEKWFKKETIPYGGIAVALTWGLAHWMTKGSLMTGLFTAVCGFGFGVVYLLLNRNIKWTFLVLCIMFIL
jgi:hypothetical protein